MSINALQMTTLLGGSPGPALTLGNLLTGVPRDITSSLFGSALATPPALSDTQSQALQSLESYILENVDESQQAGLLASLEALQALMASGNEKNAAALDPVFSLLAGNPGLLGQLPSGSLVNQLL